MPQREYYQYLELNDGTEIKYSALKYSGVYFECKTPDEKMKNGYKRAVTCWPDCIEPLRFFEVEGYTAEELLNLRKYIVKVGDVVVKMLQEEAKEHEEAMVRSMRSNSFLLLLDSQQAGGFVGAFIKHERKVFRCQAKLKTTSFGEEVFLYGANGLWKATCNFQYELSTHFHLKFADSNNRFFVENNGDQEIVVNISCSRKMRLQPGERKLICKENEEV